MKARIAIMAAVGAALAVAPTAAAAHVKWFCAYCVQAPPMPLSAVVIPGFAWLALMAVGLLMVGGAIEATALGRAILLALDRVTLPVRLFTPQIVRAVACIFFFSIALWGNVLLTPELLTSMPWVPVLQFFIAASMLISNAVPLGALGIVILYAVSIYEYGLFHMMDYPIFLGLAAYLTWTSLQLPSYRGFRPLDLFRWAMAITLLWASIEKWAYPEWSYPLFVTHPDMGMGFDPVFYMRAAGMVEFSLAFAMTGSPLVRRFASAMLLGPFIGAISSFGIVDAVGHSCIIAGLLAVLADDAERPIGWRVSAKVPFAYFCTLATVMFAYYGLHILIFGV